MGYNISNFDLYDLATQAAQCAHQNCLASQQNTSLAGASATQAANSAVSAAASAAAAAQSAEAAELYLGAFATPPDPPIEEGAIYYNTVSNVLFIWNGTAWVSSDFNEFTNFTATGTTFARNLVTRFADEVNVKDFGAVGDYYLPNGSVNPTPTNDTAAIQAALDFAALNSKSIKKVFFPSGAYSVNTIYIPNGVFVEGSGISETTQISVTTLVQRSIGDVVRFIPQNTGGKLYWFGTISNIAIFGNSSFASGWGISFRNSSGATVSMQDLSCLEHLIVRRCPSGGIEIPNSGLPITLQQIKLLFNNGPGIHITSVTTHQHQGVNFSDISGDGNNGGLIKLSGLDRSGSVNILNLKSENRINSDYGSVAMQENAIVMDGCDGTPINIFGVTHISSVPDGANFKKPGSVVKLLDGNFPNINWSAVSVRVRVGDTGPDPSIVEYSTTIAIPYTTTSGRFGNFNFSHVSQSSVCKQTLGTINSYQADSVEDAALQIGGTTPAFSLYETDQAINNKAWLMIASGGEFTLRAINDDGSLGKIIWLATRTSMQIGSDSLAVYLRIDGTTTTSAVAGAATALPATPEGYITININGTDRKIPYYKTS